METMRCLHFNDNSQNILDRDDPNYDRLCKIQPLLEMFRKSRNQYADEQVIPYKGSTSSSNICSAAHINGASKSFLRPPESYVLNLCEMLPMNRNYKLFFYNYYTFLELQLRLKRMGILSCGTIRPNRLCGCPLEQA
ncbi:hypothetical protein T4B_6963 [Trichinella pseudospiralis]|uniref:PiggyBac transposable element-derived protein domain-containing protein n=1 Tax=Trichinella pseudospiralis TaxID=6337 RepID=A0A0V1J4U2_TRIPS|nr:hypothetical protein T4E_1827 [Trichinella pseudospiralis]KRY67671.1 hypothetical protein T4A_11112 [Trichinella pseudospiralis]KRZ23833.1 hypothetical protein T4B_6963 [Trichinella pseudospiralis]KRZ29967.1 hypothetical protein T4C_5632 [Trichinella pseudospiralis]